MMKNSLLKSLALEAISGLCRICEDSNTALDILQDQKHKLAFKLNNVAGVKVTSGDGLPTSLCDHCIKQLNLTFEFKQRCERAEAKWHNLFLESQTNDMKIEPELVNIKKEYTEAHIETPKTKQNKTGIHHIRNSRKLKTNENVKKISKYNCETCSEVFEGKDDYNQHIKIHGSQRFQCQTCSKWFKHKYLLKDHREERCGNLVKFHCKICFQWYSNRANLKRHVLEQHEGIKPFECETCGKRFSQKTVLQSHRLVHQDYAFRCDQCSKQFKLEKFLLQHKQSHLAPELRDPDIVSKQSRNQVKICICPYCGKISRTLAVHNDHVRTHTKETPFACEFCSKKFKSKSALISHQLIHTGKKPHSCKACGASFRQLAHLKTHNLLRHLKEKKFSCVICSKAFALKGNLTQHMKIHKDTVPKFSNNLR
ncbi:gastrula zinc finger protein XlCGF57.1-like [Malaya genurostris]|uniref:gastrula zinc finger protein XlCGF57.1-like n=1 Tax=Malaya genurostris TaxID=325434 RepID=UPI0026F3BE4A|nr:gastrula zinc finger protein XlCGF57.1-like [Malaya genurostris]